ncbi:hypothetical protein SEUCBS139899_003857 [Sporothrix eucalyptigena]|uniref:FAD/NAD(P)-binding domain-containing protein n=1 Tax=Sporothrix eucalyptigena TaxID=1812306 RepID=A0ABP0D1L3_9PEZI
MLPESSYYWLPGLLVLASPLLFRLLSSRDKPSSQATQLSAKTHTVVVLGAGLAGVPLAHHLLKHSPVEAGVRAVLVSPNEDMLWPYATVRAILPDQFRNDQIFFPLKPAFAKYEYKYKYNAARFEHVVGCAQHLDPAANRVVVLMSLTPGGAQQDAQQERIIDYDTLVIATGSSYGTMPSMPCMPFKNLADTPATKGGMDRLRREIAAAQSIVVAGGGLTGVEVAGELGQAYGRAGTKNITLIIGGSLPLGPAVRADVRQTIVDELAKLHVTVVESTRVVDVAATAAGKHVLTLQTGTTATTMETDLYIPAFGVRPNTAFVPPAMLDADGRVAVRRDTLQPPSHANVFALGDAANAESATGKHADAQVRFLAPALQAWLAGRPIPTYKPDDTFVFAATLGPYRGTGQIGDRRLWGWVIRLLIGKHMGTNYASEIAAGSRTLTQTKW